MHFIRLTALVSSFAFETLPCLLAFHLLHSMIDIINTRFLFMFIISPAEAVLTTETFNNA